MGELLLALAQRRERREAARSSAGAARPGSPGRRRRCHGASASARTSSSSSTPGTHASRAGGGAEADGRRAVDVARLDAVDEAPERVEVQPRPVGGDGQDRARDAGDGDPHRDRRRRFDDGELDRRPSARPVARPPRRRSESPICSAGVNWSSAARSRARRRVSNTSSWVCRSSVRTAFAISPNASPSPAAEHGQNPHIANPPDSERTNGPEPPAAWSRATAACSSSRTRRPCAR